MTVLRYGRRMKPPKTKRKRKRSPARIRPREVEQVLVLLGMAGAEPERARLDLSDLAWANARAEKIRVEAWVLDLSAAALLAVLDVMPPERTPAPRGPKPKDRDTLLKLCRDFSDHSKADVARVAASREVMAHFAVQAALAKHRIAQRIEAGEVEAKVRREEEKKLKTSFAELRADSETRIESLKRKMHPSRHGRPTKLK
jgi:hypothetical protein